MTGCEIPNLDKVIEDLQTDLNKKYETLKNTVDAISTQMSALNLSVGGEGGGFAIPSLSDIIGDINPEEIITQQIVKTFQDAVKGIIEVINSIIKNIETVLCFIYDNFERL